MRKKKTEGFTLVEILLVVAIIAVLSSLLLVVTTPVRRRSRDNRRVTDIAQIRLALDLYYQKNREYPQASNLCTPALMYGLQALSAGGFIPKIPRDPSTNNCYRYATYGATPADPTGYHLAATMEGIVPAGKKGCHSESPLAGEPACFRDASGASKSANSGTGFNGAVAQTYDAAP